MKNFMLGFLVAGLLGCGALMVQKLDHEHKAMNQHRVMVDDNYNQRIEIRSLWRDNIWLRSQIPKDWMKK